MGKKESARATKTPCLSGNTPTEMEKRVEQLASREYPILLHKDKEGDYIAEIPDLPGCMTDAKSKEDALRQIEDAKRTWIAIALENGVEIPSPREMDEEPSGKLLVRLPKSLHRSLRWEAEREGISLNQSVVFLLTKALGVRSLEQARDEATKIIATTVFFPASAITFNEALGSAAASWGSVVHEPTATYGAGVFDVRCSSRRWLDFLSCEKEERADLTKTIDLLVHKSRTMIARGSGEQR